MRMKPKVIIVHGMPATGKTTLISRLSKDLGIPAIGKDTIKEFLFDQLGVKDREWSKALGAVTNDFLYMIADACLSHGQTIILENAFQPAFARAPLKDLLAKYNATCLEVYCTADREVRIKRFMDRNENGDRHPGHVDHFNYAELMNAADQDTVKYEPLEIGDYVEVDTTHFGKPEYQGLLDKASAFLRD
jgi:predicted kinase